MARRPEFTIVAGPNGAGKSKLCPFYIHTSSFDGDKLALELRKAHHDWPDRWVSGTVASELEKQKNAAIEKHVDFAFETNFSSDMPLNMISEFKDAGYKISLCYFGLDTIEQSVTRVMQRAMSGGHDVSNEVIQLNFTEGKLRIKEHLNLFENLTFIDGNANYGRIVAMHISKNRSHYVEDNPPMWFIDNFSDEFNKL